MNRKGTKILTRNKKKKPTKRASKEEYAFSIQRHACKMQDPA